MVMRKGIEINGALNLIKPPGLTSHDVVYRVRRLTGIRKVGHTGTLDPAAAGVLPLMCGHSTRLVEYLDNGWKSYRAEILLGINTDTDDSEGDIVTCGDASKITEADCIKAASTMIGEIDQCPPNHSAVWINGVRAYDLARKGRDFAALSRKVQVKSIVSTSFTSGKYPRWVVDITCGRGTYIRSIARDLGDKLGVGGTLAFLLRTSVGGFTLATAMSIEELGEMWREKGIECVMSPDIGLDIFPSVEISPDVRWRWTHGAPITVEPEEGTFKVYISGEFAGLARVKDHKSTPIVNMMPSTSRIYVDI